MPHSHDHAPSGDNCVALSEHVCIRPTIHGGDPSIHASVTDPSPAGGPVEHLAGFIIAHDELSHPDYLTRHEGALSVDPHFEGRAIWTMTGSLEGGDLTLMPSVLMYECGFHGWVKNGKWEPA